MKTAKDLRPVKHLSEVNGVNIRFYRKDGDNFELIILDELQAKNPHILSDFKRLTEKYFKEGRIFVKR